MYTFTKFLANNPRCLAQVGQEFSKMSKRFRLPVIIIFVVLAASAAYFFFFREASGDAPTINILHPTSRQQLSSGDGFMLVAEAKAEAGLNRITFLLDGELAQELRFDSPDETLALAQFPWFSSLPGRHQLSVIAFDVNGQSSELASVEVEVNAKVLDLRQAYADQILADLEGDNAERPAVADQAAVDALVAEAEANQGAAPPAQDPPPDQADDVDDDGDGGEVPPEEEEDQAAAPEQEDNAPNLTLNVSYIRQAGAGIAKISIVAEDDLGVDWIELHFLNEDGGGGQPIQYFCEGLQLCPFNFDFPFDARQWWISAFAFDVSGQSSVASVLQLEAIGDPAAFVFHDAEFAVDLSINLENFFLDEAAFGNLPNAEENDEEWIDYVLRVAPDSYFLDGCLIVQPPVLPAGPFTECQHFDLQEANLMGVDLSYANFGHTNLSGANLEGAILINAILGGGSLNGANLKGANLSNAQLDYTDLTRAVIDFETQISDKWWLVWDILTHPNADRILEGANFRFAFLKNAWLVDAHMIGADLTGADMSGANLTRADLNDADMRRAILVHSVMIDARMQGADLRVTNFQWAELYRAHWDGADLRSTDLRNSFLFGAYGLTEAQLESAILGSTQCPNGTSTIFTDGTCVNELLNH